MVSLIALRKKYKELFGNTSDIDVIIMDTLKIDRSKLFLDLAVSEESEKSIEDRAFRLKNGEPVAYITGHKEFMSLDFCVTPSTLIPRPDTEILVEKILNFYKNKSPFIFEIGTGSGCIAVSLANFIKGSKITACDISEEAIKIASKNAKLNHVNERIDFIKHDILTGFPDFTQSPDCIVSNPPYIESETIETLDDSVKNFEPLQALDGGEDGLDFYRKIINENNLKSGGLLAFEIGFNQGEKVKNLMQKDFYNIEVAKDLGGNDRVVTGVKK